MPGLCWRRTGRDTSAHRRTGSDQEPEFPALTMEAAEPGGALQPARDDHDSVVNLTRALVRIPGRFRARAGILSGCVSSQSAAPPWRWSPVRVAAPKLLFNRLRMARR